MTDYTKTTYDTTCSCTLTVAGTAISAAALHDFTYSSHDYIYYLNGIYANIRRCFELNPRLLT